MSIFRHGNIREFSRNNQTTIKYKNLICLSNFPFNYFVESWYMSQHTTPLLQGNRKLHFLQCTRVFLWQILYCPWVMDAGKR